MTTDHAIPAKDYYVDSDPAAKGQVVVVVSRAGGKVDFHEEGGGFIVSWPAEKFNARFSFLSNDDYHALRRVYTPVQIVGDWMEDGYTIPGYTNGTAWNGWASPCFEKEAFLDAVKAGWVFSYKGKDTGLAYYDAERDAIVVATSDGLHLPPIVTEDFVCAALARNELDIKLKDADLMITVYEGFNINTPSGEVRAYSVGSHEWCWCISETPEMSAVPAPSC